MKMIKPLLIDVDHRFFWLHIMEEVIKGAYETQFGTAL